MNRDPSQNEPEIPSRLAEAIRRYEAGRGAGGAGAGADLSGLDRAVLGEARGRFRTTGLRRSAVIGRIGGALAAAAGLALAVIVIRPGSVQGPAAVVAFDSSKAVTILDAFQLARLLEAGRGGSGSGPRPLSPTWDVTGDGAIDQRDVDAIAARAVQLSGGGGGA
jgi:hypothetical protein